MICAGGVQSIFHLCKHALAANWAACLLFSGFLAGCCAFRIIQSGSCMNKTCFFLTCCRLRCIVMEQQRLIIINFQFVHCSVAVLGLQLVCKNTFAANVFV